MTHKRRGGVLLALPHRVSVAGWCAMLAATAAISLSLLVAANSMELRGGYGGSGTTTTTTRAAGGGYGGTTTQAGGVYGGTTTQAGGVYGGTTTHASGGGYGGTTTQAATTTHGAGGYGGTTTQAGGVYGGTTTQAETTTHAGGGYGTTTQAGGVYGGTTTQAETTTPAGGVYGGTTTQAETTTQAGGYGGSTTRATTETTTKTVVYTTKPHKSTSTTSTTTHKPTKTYTSSTSTSTKPTKSYTSAPTTQSAYDPTATGYINLTVTDLNPSAFTPICSQGAWGLYGITLKVWLTLALFGGHEYSTPPLTSLLSNARGETITINVKFYFNAAAVSIHTSEIFNVANSRANGNVWSFQLEDWQSNIGGSFFFDGVAPCSWQSEAPSITVAFSTDGQFVVGRGSSYENIPAISAFPNIINHLESRFIAP